MNKNAEAFLALVRAGLWEKEVRLSPSNIIDFKGVLRIAEEQSVVGLLASGIKHVQDFRMPQIDVLTIVGRALQIEQQNIAMNQFVVRLFAKLQAENINALLVKGQGIARCYERPLWRACGDVDLLLDTNNYNKAKTLLIPLANSVETEKQYEKHLGLTIDSWFVELHGNLRTSLSSKIDKFVDEIQTGLSFNENVLLWKNGNIQVFLPSADFDAIIIFTHIIKHLFQGGIGLRQICDWCRLLWTFKDSIDKDLLYKRLKTIGLLSEWKVFASLAVDQLGMPAEAMHFYDNAYQNKAKKILSFILESGNFGHNKDIGYQKKYLGVVRKSLTLMKQAKESVRLARIFPLDAPKFFVWFVVNKNKETA